MSFPHYPAYKDSGVEWIGDVPEHWNVTRVRWLFEIRKRIAGELGFDVFSITQQGFRVKDLDSNEGQVSLDYSKYQFVEVGDFAMNHMDLITGGVDVAQSRGVTSPDYRVFSIHDRLRVHDRYFLYLFQNCLRERIFFAYGQGSSQLGRWRFPTDNFKDFRFPVPPPVDQALVAAFLDRETAKIDALVDEQRRLIDLLKEKRQAVISHAVTEGLNPRIPMKPSGVEWLGDVPNHWKIDKLSSISEVVAGFAFDGSLLGLEGMPVIRMSDFGNGVLDVETAKRVDPILVPDKALAQVGDVLLGLSGSISNFAIVRDQDIPIAVNQRVAIVRADGMVRRLLSWFLQSNEFLNQITADLPETTLQNVSMDQLRRCRVPIPPPMELVEICDFLDRKTARLADMLTEGQRSIHLLQERRTALISAAVTGKIDVRGLVNTEAA